MTTVTTIITLIACISLASSDWYSYYLIGANGNNQKIQSTDIIFNWGRIELIGNQFGWVINGKSFYCESHGICSINVVYNGGTVTPVYIVEIIASESRVFFSIFGDPLVSYPALNLNTYSVAGTPKRYKRWKWPNNPCYNLFTYTVPSEFWWYMFDENGYPVSPWGRHHTYRLANIDENIGIKQITLVLTNQPVPNWRDPMCVQAPQPATTHIIGPTGPSKQPINVEIFIILFLLFLLLFTCVFC
eukprot:427187_1